MEDELSGDDFFSRLEISFEDSNRRGRGRPQSVDAASLLQRRDGLVVLFEEHWHEIGWGLQTATNMGQLREALSPLPQDCRSHLETLLYPATGTGNSQQLRKTRRQIQETGKRLHEAEVQEEKLKSLLLEADSALNDCDDTARYEAVRREHGRRENRLQEQLASIESLQKRYEELRELQKVQQAAFSQAELLRFTTSTRYSIEPLSVANAVAGLPQLGWRQSFKRCQTWNRNASVSPSYAVFLSIRRALSHLDLSRRSLVEGIRAWLMTARNLDDRGVSELRKNWYYLRRASETVSSDVRDARQLPFVVTTAYLSLVGDARPTDKVLAGEEALDREGG